MEVITDKSKLLIEALKCVTCEGSTSKVSLFFILFLIVKKLLFESRFECLRYTLSLLTSPINQIDFKHDFRSYAESRKEGK